jgi:hypothetical protein
MYVLWKEVMTKKLLIAVTLFFFYGHAGAALTPIAKTDVVPYQRIEYGTTFKFGVIAFSKAGVDNVSFAISSGTATYTGSSPKVSSSMALNTRVAHSTTDGPSGHTGWAGVWEYYIEIPASDFSSNGTFTVTPTVNGSDSGTKVLSAVTLYVEATGAGAYDYCYADSVSGNDGTCSANSSNKCATLGKAMELVQAANSGSSSGCTVYLEEGTYGIPDSGTVAVSASGEWLTIKNAPGADRDNIVINDSGTSIASGDRVKFEGVTLTSNAPNDYTINAKSGQVNGDSVIWIKNCKLTNPDGRYDSAGQPDPNAFPVNYATYITETYIYDVDRAFTIEPFIRNVTIYKLAEDVGRNGDPLMVNVRVDDQDNGGVNGCWHADTYQNFSRIMSDAIFYNIFVTDAHYQGPFFRGSTASGAHTNVALVNWFQEMRDPTNYGTWNGSSCEGTTMVAGSLYFDTTSAPHWNHFIMWHCSFPYMKFNFFYPSGSGAMTDSSFIGNIFYEIVDNSDACVEISALEYGNSDGNEALYNHYKSSASEISSPGSGCCLYANSYVGGCPYFYSKAPDSSDGRTTVSHGGLSFPEVLDLTDTTNYSDFGKPLDAATDIIETVSVKKIPADVWGNERPAFPSRGAVEYNVGSTTPSASGITFSGVTIGQ